MWVIRLLRWLNHIRIRCNDNRAGQRSTVRVGLWTIDCLVDSILVVLHWLDIVLVILAMVKLSESLVILVVLTSLCQVVMRIDSDLKLSR